MRKIVYLDHAATSWPKPSGVLKAAKEAVVRFGGNPGRSGHALSAAAADVVFSAREAVADLLGITDPACVTFTQNATYALNTAIKSAMHQPCHILISDIEHNAVFRPVHALTEQQSFTYSVFSTTGDIAKNIKNALRSDTRMLISSLASNVTGREVPLSILSDIRRTYGIYTIADASQLIGHAPIDLSGNPVDVLCAPGHKGLFGLMGAGFAVYEKPPPYTLIEGGSGSESRNYHMPKDLPERLEAGTLPVPSIASLTAGIDFIREIEVEKIRQKLNQMTEHISDELSKIEGVHIIDTPGHGVVSFICDAFSSETFSRMLDRKNICTRAGLHCAPLAHTTFGTQESGSVRVSIAATTTDEDLLHFLRTAYSLIRQPSKHV